jgi:hypothetical protein
MFMAAPECKVRGWGCYRFAALLSRLGFPLRTRSAAQAQIAMKNRCEYLLTTKRNYSNYVVGILRAGRDAWRIVLIESKETESRIPEPASLSCLTGETQLQEGDFYQTKPKDEMKCESMSYL